jgi:hypothetical protein
MAILEDARPRLVAGQQRSCATTRDWLTNYSGGGSPTRRVRLL